MQEQSSSADCDTKLHVAQMDGSNDEALRSLLTNFEELNASVVQEVTDITPLEFMRHVARNEPVIIRGGAQHWPAYRKWTAKYLLDLMRDDEVNVALTPHGMADSVQVDQQTGSKLYVEPYERTLAFREVLAYIQAQERETPEPGVPIMYAQTQNDNLYKEYPSLSADVPSGVDFARIALQQNAPDAVNFWLGNSRSTTSIYRDNYENIFVQIRGSKRFILLPPVAAACMQERDCKRARFVATNDAPTDGVRDIRLEQALVEPMTTTPIPTWDPEQPHELPNRLASLVRPRVVIVREGDMLYLPALWYHKVTQEAGEEGFCCSINYWYDMDHSGPFWSMTNFVRDVARGS